jgi:hypothetical protein
MGAGGLFHPSQGLIPTFPYSNLASDGVWTHPDGKFGITAEGGFAVKLINKTGAATVRGVIVEADSTTDDAFDTASADELQNIGVVYEEGVADGSEAWVVIGGRCQVLLKDSTLSTRGNWVYTSDTAGRADATLAAPPGGGIPELETHMQEIGHCIQSVAAGTNQLAFIILHFN